MRHRIACAAACGLLAFTPAPALADDEGSGYVRCDGRPSSMGAGEMAARLLVIMATSGLAGGGEQADPGKRVDGKAGVAACDEALTTEKDAIRRVELTLARSVHNVEADDYEAALADARSIKEVAGEEALDRGFRKSLLASAMELEALALAGLGRPEEAEAAALKMADIAPYDILNQQRASPYIGLTPEMTPEKAAYLDRYVRILPGALLKRSILREWAGDFAGAAKDIDSLIQVQSYFVDEDERHKAAPPFLTARRAVALMLAGDMAQSNAVAEATRAKIEGMIKSGEAVNEHVAVSQAEEQLAFQAIGRQLAEGKALQARAVFAARSRWTYVSAAAVAVMAERLRDGADPAELTGPLAEDPATIRAEGMASVNAALTENERREEILKGVVRPRLRERDYNQYASKVWRAEKSRYFVEKTAKNDYSGEFYVVDNGYTTAAGEALFLHLAAVARARGKAGFMVTPGRRRIQSLLVVFGDPDDGVIPADVLIHADAVVEALSQDMPAPA